MKLRKTIVQAIQSLVPQFGYNGFGEFVFYRTYSRLKEDGTMESWNDVVIRVTEGVFSIRREHYEKNGIPWDEDSTQAYAYQFALSMFRMEWLPPGRGLWAMGTPYMWEKGGACLNNCAFVTIKHIANDASWVMDMLMNGVGVGFAPRRDDNLTVYLPDVNGLGARFTIPDDREGWVESIRILIESYMTAESAYVEFDYSKIRAKGAPIRGFGGTASGPEPLQELHKNIEEYFEAFCYRDDYDSVRLKTDIVNAIACCVVAGNVRRSAEIAVGSPSDPTFLDLKNYEMHPERARIGGYSNNSVALEDDEDFEMLHEVADRVKTYGEPGILNLRTLNEGRLGKDNSHLRTDDAIGINPCGEMPLEDCELCCLAETFPTRCKGETDWYKACEYATLYASTVTLLPTHSERTNAVMLRNRRIGISITGVTDWLHQVGANQVIKHLRKGYNVVCATNHWANSEAGVPDAIRHTTVKPSGTVSKLAGVAPGVHYPTFKYTLMRVRVAKDSAVAPLLIAAGIPHEDLIFDSDTWVFEWPVEQGPAKPATDASMWEQAMNIVMMQREWSDNAVSNTIYFKPSWVLVKTGADPDTVYDPATHKLEADMWGSLNLYAWDPNHEEDEIEHLLAMLSPLTKSLSMMPHSADGVYPQSPQSGLTFEEYEQRLAAMKTVDWTGLMGEDSVPEKYCSGAKCEI